MSEPQQIKLNRSDFFGQLFGQYLKEKKGYIETREFLKGENGPISKFHNTIEEIANHNPQGDFYYGVCPRDTNANGMKANIHYITTLWADVDYGENGHRKKAKFETQAEALSEVQKFQFKPSLIVDSGGGLHLYWLLNGPEEIKEISYVEGIIKGITQSLGGDVGTQDVTRILRVPETNNLKIPDKPRPCKVIEFNKDVRYRLLDFEHYAISLPADEILSKISFSEELPNVDVQKLKISDRIKHLIEYGDTKKKYASRSEADQAVIMALVSGGYDDNHIKAIFFNPKYAIGEKYREKGVQADNYLGLSIANAIKFNKQNRKNKKSLPVIHLVDIERSQYAGQMIKTPVMIAGVGDSFLIPRRYTIACMDPECKDRCGLYDKPKVRKFNKEDPALIEMTLLAKHNLNAFLRSCVTECTSVMITINEYFSLQTYLACPKVKVIQQKKDETDPHDEKGRDYREKVIYNVGAIDKSNTYYNAIGKVLPNPKNQKATLLATTMEKTADFYEEFVLNAETKKHLKLFTPDTKSKEGIKEKINDILDDITNHITFVVGAHKKRMLEANLLTWVSPLQIYYDNSFLKGTVDTIILGDTGQAKTTQAQRLVMAIGLGAIINGGMAGRTGLLYSLDDKINNLRLIRWGIIPLMHKKLVIVDECQKISASDWEEMSKARSEGLASVTKSKHGEHPMVTRQIYIGNPKDPSTQKEKGVDEFMYGIEAVQFLRPSDIRRFDIVVLVSIGDDDSSVINKLIKNKKVPTQIYTPSVLQNLVSWAWTKPYYILDTTVWEDGSDRIVGEVADELIKIFNCFEIPLFIEDTKDKVARLSASVANLCPFVIDSKIHIYPAHVYYIKNFLVDNYTHKSNCLDKFALMKRNQKELSDADFMKILEEITKSPDGLELLDMFKESEYTTRDELLGYLGLTSNKSAAERTGIFKKHGLISSSYKGYSKRPKFIKFLKQLEDELGKKKDGK